MWRGGRLIGRLRLLADGRECRRRAGSRNRGASSGGPLRCGSMRVRVLLAGLLSLIAVSAALGAAGTFSSVAAGRRARRCARAGRGPRPTAPAARPPRLEAPGERGLHAGLRPRGLASPSTPRRSSCAPPPRPPPLGAGQPRRRIRRWRARTGSWPARPRSAAACSTSSSTRPRADTIYVAAATRRGVEEHRQGRDVQARLARRPDADHRRAGHRPGRDAVRRHRRGGARRRLEHLRRHGRLPLADGGTTLAARRPGRDQPDRPDRRRPEEPAAHLRGRAPDRSTCTAAAAGLYQSDRRRRHLEAGPDRRQRHHRRGRRRDRPAQLRDRLRDDVGQLPRARHAAPTRDWARACTSPPTAARRGRASARRSSARAPTSGASASRWRPTARSTPTPRAPAASTTASTARPTAARHGRPASRRPVPQDSFYTYGWWFGRIYVDPKDSKHVYQAALVLQESKDGGQTWNNAPGSCSNICAAGHADNHGMAWDPKVPNRVYLGNDGGVFRSDDNGGQVESLQVPADQPGQRLRRLPAATRRRMVVGLQDNGVEPQLAGATKARRRRPGRTTPAATASARHRAGRQGRPRLRLLAVRRLPGRRRRPAGPRRARSAPTRRRWPPRATTGSSRSSSTRTTRTRSSAAATSSTSRPTTATPGRRSARPPRPARAARPTRCSATTGR